jgi:hypothetical protein
LRKRLCCGHCGVLKSGRSAASKPHIKQAAVQNAPTRMAPTKANAQKTSMRSKRNASVILRSSSVLTETGSRLSIDGFREHSRLVDDSVLNA